MFADLEGGRYFFNAVKEGDSILYACDDENECHLWVMAMYRATGQSHKPTPLVSTAGKNSTISKIQGGMFTLLPSINIRFYNFQTCSTNKRLKQGTEGSVVATILVRVGSKHRQHRRAPEGLHHIIKHKNEKLLTETMNYTRSTSM